MRGARGYEKLTWLHYLNRREQPSMSPSRRYVVPGQLKASRAALMALGVIFFGHATAAGSVDAGKAKAAVCAACHGNDGNSLNPEWPSLAGQHETYIVN